MKGGGEPYRGKSFWFFRLFGFWVVGGGGDALKVKQVINDRKVIANFLTRPNDANGQVQITFTPPILLSEVGSFSMVRLSWLK